MKEKFYICRRCGNVIEKIADGGVPVVCCGKPMDLLEAGVVDASREKHVPVVKVDGNFVYANVGSVTHPMSVEHNIAWIALVTDKGIARRTLAPAEAPEAVFALADERPVAVYAYCNLHGLWRADI